MDSDNDEVNAYALLVSSVGSAAKRAQARGEPRSSHVAKKQRLDLKQAAAVHDAQTDSESEVEADELDDAGMSDAGGMNQNADDEADDDALAAADGLSREEADLNASMVTSDFADTWADHFADSRVLDADTLAGLREPASFKMQRKLIPGTALKEHVFFDRGDLPARPLDPTDPYPEAENGVEDEDEAVVAPSARLLAYQVKPVLAAQWAVAQAQAQAQQQQSPAGDSKSNKKGARAARLAAAAMPTDLSERAALARFHSPLQRELFGFLNSYRDVWFANRTIENAQPLRELYTLHVLNHVFKTREAVLAHNEVQAAAEARRRDREHERKLRERAEAEQARARGDTKHRKRKRKQLERSVAEGAPLAEIDPVGAEDEAEVEAADPGALRDQGYTRARVLVLLPFQNSAYAFVNGLLRLLPAARRQQVFNRRRFEEEYGPPRVQPESEDEEDEEEEETAGAAGAGAGEKKAPKQKKKRKDTGAGAGAGVKERVGEEIKMDPRKPADYRALLEGSTTDTFRIGISFTRQSVKLFADLYTADIILASPLGLRTIIGGEGDKKEDRDYDFLSAIELCVLDQAEVFNMQNWQHVQTIFSVINSIPYDAHGADFSRIRQWSLDGQAKYFRQTLMLSAHQNPDLQRFFSRQCLNASGRLSLRAVYEGSLGLVRATVRQIFQRVACGSVREAADRRFEHFTGQVLPKVRAAAAGGRVLIFVPSYFDFVRVRNYMRAHKYSFLNCSEYTPGPDVSRARSAFFHGKTAFLLVTERFHFFHRFTLRGVRHLLFYAPPEHGHFYPEFVDMTAMPLAPRARARADDDEGEGRLARMEQSTTCMLLYMTYDALALERIVGTERCIQLLDSKNSVHMFV